MKKLKLVFLDTKYKKQYIEMIEECKDDIRNWGFEFSIPLSNIDTFETDVKKLIDMNEGKGLPDGWVPASFQRYWIDV